MSERIAKRQRIGSYSPGSPPYHHAAKHNETKTPIVHPNTPTSPPYSSMNPNPNGSSATTATATQASVMTPPSSVIMSQQHSQSAPSTTNPPTFPTPVSTAGPSHSLNIDSDGDALMEEAHGDGALRLGGHRRTDHNRQGGGNIFAPEGGVAAAKGICGSQLFLGCQSTYEPSRPHASQNLFELYGLNRLAASVARTDPNTGEKTNKLRKSYEGQIKKMQVAGKVKAVKMDRKLTDLMHIPDFEFQAQQTNKEVEKTALNPQGTGLNFALGDLIDAALVGMGPGDLPHPDAAKYRQYLGTDDTAKPKPGPAAAPQQRVAPSAAATPGNHTPVSRLSRPERTGSKRQYTDASYHGYGEGYGDDYADSTGGEDNAKGNMAKRRKMAFEQRSRPVEVGGGARH